MQRSLPHACACGTYHVHERISPCTPLLASPPFAPPAPYDFCTPHAAAPPGSAHPPPPPTPGPPCTFPRSTRATSLHLISYSRHDRDPLPLCYNGALAYIVPLRFDYPLPSTLLFCVAQNSTHTLLLPSAPHVTCLSAASTSAASHRPCTVCVHERRIDTNCSLTRQ